VGEPTPLLVNLKPLHEHIRENHPMPDPASIPAPQITKEESFSASLQEVGSPKTQIDASESKQNSTDVSTPAPQQDTFFSWMYKSVAGAPVGTASAVTEGKDSSVSAAGAAQNKVDSQRTNSLVSLHLVVFSYGACFLHRTPATIYITPQYVCFSCGFPGFTFITREVYPISKLMSVKVVAPEAKAAGDSPFSLAQSLQPTSLYLVFFSGAAAKELRVTPAVLDCNKLRILLTELREMDSFEWFTLPSDPKASILGTEGPNEESSDNSTTDGNSHTPVSTPVKSDRS
jgi:hypothetical protein